MEFGGGGGGQILGTTRFQVELYRVSVWINWCVPNLVTEVIQLPRKRNLISSRVTVRRYLCTRIEATGMDFLGLLSSVSSGRKQAGLRRVSSHISFDVSHRFSILPSLQKSLRSLNSSSNFSSSIFLITLVSLLDDGQR